jgi:hypothetical protein
MAATLFAFYKQIFLLNILKTADIIKSQKEIIFPSDTLEFLKPVLVGYPE